MEYLGNVLTDNGLQVSNDKVEAIVQAPRPKDQSDVTKLPWFSAILLKVHSKKVKYDHRSKFSNLSNWKEEA